MPQIQPQRSAPHLPQPCNPWAASFVVRRYFRVGQHPSQGVCPQFAIGAQRSSQCLVARALRSRIAVHGRTQTTLVAVAAPRRGLGARSPRSAARVIRLRKTQTTRIRGGRRKQKRKRSSPIVIVTAIVTVAIAAVMTRTPKGERRKRRRGRTRLRKKPRRKRNGDTTVIATRIAARITTMKYTPKAILATRQIGRISQTTTENTRNADGGLVKKG